MCGMCSALTTTWRGAGVFIGSFGRDWRLFLVFLLLTLGREMPAGY